MGQEVPSPTDAGSADTPSQVSPAKTLPRGSVWSTTRNCAVGPITPGRSLRKERFSTFAPPGSTSANVGPVSDNSQGHAAAEARAFKEGLATSAHLHLRRISCSSILAARACTSAARVATRSGDQARFSTFLVPDTKTAFNELGRAGVVHFTGAPHMIFKDDNTSSARNGWPFLEDPDGDALAVMARVRAATASSESERPAWMAGRRCFLGGAATQAGALARCRSWRLVTG